MRLIYLALLVLSLSLLYTPIPISAHFFPNETSIPPLLNSTRCNWDSFRNLSGCHAGEKVDGLSNLKKYFQYFGYINNASNFTDDFDEALKSALETYQKNFNLNVTGELDDFTVQQIVRPRCGVADIVNGTSTMNSGKSNTSSTRFHTVSHYTLFPDERRWPQSKRDLTYAFNPDINLSDEVKSMFALAGDNIAQLRERWTKREPLNSDSNALAKVSGNSKLLLFLCFPFLFLFFLLCCVWFWGTFLN